MIDACRSWLHRLEQRPLTRRNRFGALLAVLTCPCHAGVLVILTSGTALGGWLAFNQAWLYAGLAVLFVAGLWLLFRTDPRLAARFRCGPDCDTGGRAIR